jgi:hypothetical protein
MRCTAVIAAIAATVMAAPPAAGVSSFFETVSEHEVVGGPPYPTACHLTDVAHEAYATFERDGQLALAIASALDESGAASLELRWAGGPTPGGGFQSDTSFDLWYDPAGEGERTGSTVLADLNGTLEAASGSAGKLDALHAELPLADPLRYFEVCVTDVSAEFTCRVDLSHGVVHELTLLAEVPADVSVAGARVAIRPQTIEDNRHGQPTLADSYFSSQPDADFDTILILKTDEDDVEAQLLATITITGRYLGGTSPVERTSWGKIKTLYDE